MTILMRLDCNAQSIDRDELLVFMGWLRTMGVEPELTRAAAIESIDDDRPGWFRLHTAQYHRQGPGAITWDPATNEPRLTYQTIDFEGWTWPFVQATERIPTA